MARRCSRRSFFRNSVGLSSLAVLGCKTTSNGASAVAAAGSSSSSTVLVRNNLNSPAGIQDLQTYAKIVGFMKAGPQWAVWANIHNDHCPHNNWYFLPWHRWYVHYFEEVCRGFLRQNNMSDAWSLPYWNWADNNGAIPAAFWTAGSPLLDTNRDFTQTSTLSMDSVGPAVIAKILQIPDFLTFGSGRAAAQRDSGDTGQLEGTPHNDVHSEIGGDMGTFLSPTDPIFWVHHCNVDRLWAEWAAQHPDAQLPTNPNTKDRKAKAGEVQLTADFWQDFTLEGYVDFNGQPLTGNPRSCLSTMSMPVPYTYDTLPSSGSGLSLDGSALTPSPTQRTVTVYVEDDFPQPITSVDQVNQIIYASLPYGSDLQPYIQNLLAGNPRSGTLTLLINNVPIPTDTATHNIVLSLFANFPQVTSTANATDPHFLTCLAFFAHNHPGAPTALNFSIDLTGSVGTLQQAGIDVSQGLTLQVLVQDRKLQALPSAAFFQGITLSLVYTETQATT